MIEFDEFTRYYEDHLDSSYDCVDRIVLNAYFYMGQSGGGFRTWWRRLHGTDDNLNDTRLMRFAGRFARRVKAVAEKRGIPIIRCERGVRLHEIADAHRPTDPEFCGVFCILIKRAPAALRQIQHGANGVPHIIRKTPMPFANHYSFHIMDREWGHVTITLCPHPPFNASIILNGHEYVARQSRQQDITFTKEGNCFTDVSDAAGLGRIAETMTASSCVGRLVQVCDRWIYSSCLCFALSAQEREASGFRYAYSVYQAEYSRNLLFGQGRTLDHVFEGVIDRTRAQLDMKTVRTIFGYHRRPARRKGQNKPPRFEVVVEKPAYNLTVFKVHFGLLTVRMYSKGERVLRIEVVVHNTKPLRWQRGVENFPDITARLRSILERFLDALSAVDVSFIDDGTLESWPQPSKVGASRMAGLNVTQPRIRAAMQAAVALSTHPHGFTASEHAQQVRTIMDVEEGEYHSRHASYDLKKLRGHGLVVRIPGSRRYEVPRDGVAKMAAFMVLRDKVLMPLLSSATNPKADALPPNRSEIDIQYERIQLDMLKLFEIIGIAA